MKKTLFLFPLFLLFAIKGFAQFQIPEIPEKQTSFYDYVGLLNQSGARFLEEKLLQYSDSSSAQIVIVIIDSSKGEKILDLATRWGKTWGIGQEGMNNGVVLLMSKEDREVAIAVGSGLNDQLTDANAKRVIDERIVPQFKKGKYYKGLDLGIDGIIAFLEGNFDKNRAVQSSEGIISNAGNSFWDKVTRNLHTIAFVVIAILAFFFAPKRAPTRRDDHWDDDRDDHWHNNDWGGGDYDSDDSSGFDDGFGGGDFDGGGASGKW